MTKILGTILTGMTFGLLFVLCLAFVAIRVSGLATYIVTGGSMEPTIHKGSLVLVQPSSPSQAAVGDVITFEQYGQTTTHRIIQIAQTAQGEAFTTKGDANTVADPEAKTFPGQVGIVRLVVPAAGYVTAYVQAYWRLALSVVAAIVFFACAGLLMFRKETELAVPPVRVTRAGRPLVARVEMDAAWDAHLAWVRRSAQRRTQVA